MYAKTIEIRAIAQVNGYIKYLANKDMNTYVKLYMMLFFDFRIT